MKNMKCLPSVFCNNNRNVAKEEGQTSVGVGKTIVR